MKIWIFAGAIVLGLAAAALALPTPYQAQERKLASCELAERQNEHLRPLRPPMTDDEAESWRIVDSADLNFCMLAGGYQFNDKAPCPEVRDSRAAWDFYNKTRNFRCFVPQTWLKRQAFLAEDALRNQKRQKAAP